MTNLPNKRVEIDGIIYESIALAGRDSKIWKSAGTRFFGRLQKWARDAFRGRKLDEEASSFLRAGVDSIRAFLERPQIVNQEKLVQIEKLRSEIHLNKLAAAKSIHQEPFDSKQVALENRIGQILKSKTFIEDQIKNARLEVINEDGCLIVIVLPNQDNDSRKGS